jgi:hypothetical protein
MIESIMINYSSFLPCYLLAAGAHTGSLLFLILKRDRAAKAFLFFGFLAHTASLVIRGWYFGIFHPMNMFTELYFLPWVLCGIILWQTRRHGTSKNGITLIVPLCLLIALSLIPPVTTLPPFPLTATIFATLFFVVEVIAHGVFLLGGWYGLLYLSGRTTEQSFNRYAIWGFILYSLAQVLGAAWSYLGWSTPFHWGERHLLSAALWCFYCAYLHLQFSPRWSTIGKARFAVCGALIMLVFTYGYLLVNLGAKHG